MTQPLPEPDLDFPVSDDGQDEGNDPTADDQNDPEFDAAE